MKFTAMNAEAIIVIGVLCAIAMSAQKIADAVMAWF